MRRAFSLVELMIVIAIVGILAGIAVPVYQESTLTAKRAEALPILKGISDAQVAYEITSGVYVTGLSNPGTSIGKDARAFSLTKTGWVDLGFSPDGLIRCNYATGQYGSSPVWARVDAMCDVDDDNKTATIRYYTSREDQVGYFYDLYPERF